MSCEDDTAEVLREAGHKLTPQRLMIARALRHAGGHVSAAQLAEQVREEYPFVDTSTVYRTLDVLKRMKLATATDMGTGDAAFEWAPALPHHHLICTACGYVIEVNHGYLSRLGAELDRDFGFESDLQHFAIFGLCKACQEPEA